MNWFYTENNEQRGPVTEGEFEFLVRAGKIKSDTLVWREGMAGWQPFCEIAPPPSATDMPPPLAGSLQIPGAAADSAERNGPAWEQRESLGMMHAAVETVKAVLQNPSETFSRMKREGGLTAPLTYAMIVGGVGSYVGVIYSLAGNLFGGGLQKYGNFGTGGQAAAQQFLVSGAGITIGLIAALFVVPLAIALTTFVHSAIVHLCLMLLGGAKQPFETTFRVVCYSMGSAAILQVIPLCGGLVCAIWNLVATCIGLAKAHDIPTGKAVAAVLLPMLCCCALLFALFIFVGSFTAFSAHH